MAGSLQNCLCAVSIERAVLRIDEEPVKSDFSHNFGNLGIRKCYHGSNQHITSIQSFPEI
jgi:hypothetical protein